VTDQWAPAPHECFFGYGNAEPAKPCLDCGCRCVGYQRADPERCWYHAAVAKRAREDAAVPQLRLGL
jgi:hypothetical protein